MAREPGAPAARDAVGGVKGRQQERTATCCPLFQHIPPAGEVAQTGHVSQPGEVSLSGALRCVMEGMYGRVTRTTQSTAAQSTTALSPFWAAGGGNLGTHNMGCQQTVNSAQSSARNAEDCALFTVCCICALFKSARNSRRPGSVSQLLRTLPFRKAAARRARTTQRLAPCHACPRLHPFRLVCPHLRGYALWDGHQEAQRESNRHRLQRGHQLHALRKSIPANVESAKLTVVKEPHGARCHLAPPSSHPKITALGRLPQ
eukprot:50510-Chlamydomonas_euryale.AAC.2